MESDKKLLFKTVYVPECNVFGKITARTGHNLGYCYYIIKLETNTYIEKYYVRPDEFNKTVFILENDTEKARLTARLKYQTT
jgi:hypothetical protein